MWVVLQLFWIPAPFKDIGCCIFKKSPFSKLTLYLTLTLLYMGVVIITPALLPTLKPHSSNRNVWFGPIFKWIGSHGYQLWPRPRKCFKISTEFELCKLWQNDQKSPCKVGLIWLVYMLLALQHFGTKIKCLSMSRIQISCFISNICDWFNLFWKLPQLA